MSDEVPERGPYDPTVNFAIYVRSGPDSLVIAGGREHLVQAEADALQLVGQGDHGVITDARTGQTITDF